MHAPILKKGLWPTVGHLVHKCHKRVAVTYLQLPSTMTPTCGLGGRLPAIQMDLSFNKLDKAFCCHLFSPNWFVFGFCMSSFISLSATIGQIRDKPDEHG